MCQRTYLVLFLVNGLCASELLLEICHLSGIVAWNLYCCLKFAIYLPMAFHFIMLFGKMVHLRFCLVKSYGWAYLFSSWMSTYIQPQRCDHSWWFAACLHIWAINDYNLSSSQPKSSSTIWVGYIAGCIWHGSGIPPAAGWVINHALSWESSVGCLASSHAFFFFTQLDPFKKGKECWDSAVVRLCGQT